MTRTRQLTYGLLLTALAGYVDALGFVRLGGLYTSFMSGNTTQLGVALGHAALEQLAMPAALLGMFLVGALLGSGLAILVPDRWATPVVLSFEAVMILAALAFGLGSSSEHLASLFLALAMGAQNAVLAAVKNFRAGTTFVTGALFSLGQKIAASLTRTGPALGWVGDAAVWLSLMAGAIAGAVAYARFDLYALVAPAALAGALAVTAVVSVAARREMT